MKIRDIIPVARGDVAPDALVVNGKLLNVFTGEVETGQNVAIFRKRIAGIGDYRDAPRIIDAQGGFLLPGFIDAHLHIESSMLVPHRFAEAILRRGTTTVIADPHEIGNVLGTRGVESMIESTAELPLDVYIGIPSAVPATRFETAGAHIGTDDMLFLVDRYPRRIIALGEVMNYPAVLEQDRELITKIEILRHRYKKIDGHAPGLSGKLLNAYCCGFIRSDHECSTPDEALEKVSRGMQVFIREGSAARNLDALIGAVTPQNHPYFSFCTDDRDPLEIHSEGHIDHLVRTAIQKGVDPVIAIRMATINTARHFSLRSMGAIAPSYKADLLVVGDLKALDIRQVIKNGRLVVQDGELLEEIPEVTIPHATESFHLPELSIEDLAIPAQSGKIRCIQLCEGSLLTEATVVQPKVDNGQAVPDPERDLAKIIVVDRHRGSGFAKGFLSGLGLKVGAVATSVGHDAHNLSAAGTNDADILAAARQVGAWGGGMAVVQNGELLAGLPLPVAGLMSDRSLAQVNQALSQIRVALRSLGTEREVFMTLSFVQLAVIPSLRITDQGLVDVAAQERVELWVENVPGAPVPVIRPPMS